MQNEFTAVQMKAPETATFDYRHDRKTTFGMGTLVPIFCIETLPGDYFKWRIDALLRFQPLIAPVMHMINATTFFYFVPWRLLWPSFTKWISRDLDVEAPWCSLPYVEPGQIADHLNLPLYYSPNAPAFPVIRISPAQLAGYYLIWDEQHRDQNNQLSEKFVQLVAGENDAYSDAYTDNCLKRAWMHDYFTSALPFAQKGEAVALPLTNPQRVVVDFFSVPPFINGDGTPHPNFQTVVGSTVPGGDLINSGGANYGVYNNTVVAGNHLAYNPDRTLSVDINEEAVLIDTLNRAIRLQEWLQKNARGGTRYIELIESHFDVKSSDARLQRPEYLGSMRQHMVISEVLSTAETLSIEDGTTDPLNISNPVGQMAGHGISAGRSKSFSYRCEEHGFLYALVNVQPLTAYQQGIHPSFTRFDPLDYAWPTFAHIGEQPIKLKELFVPNTGTTLLESYDPEAIFGYIPRYAEYRYMNSSVTGQMRTTLNFWHMGRIFSNDTIPTLNSEFIQATVRKDAFAVSDPTDDEIIAHFIINMSANRRLPRFGTPLI